jgi:hypothetical protein
VLRGVSRVADVQSCVLEAETVIESVRSNTRLAQRLGDGQSGRSLALRRKKGKATTAKGNYL